MPPSTNPADHPKEPRSLAELARLRYVTDTMPGIRRRRAGRGFSYIDPRQRRLTRPQQLRRIERLAIPPAWTDVWICPLSYGHLQATGRDERGRKQYVYHDRWHEVTNRTKFDRMLDFGRALPKFRQQIHRDMKLPGLSKRRVVATVIELLDQTAMRVGNEEYVRQNNSFGITTLRDHHIRVEGPRVRFRFHGKGGQLHQVDVNDRRLARIVQRCEEIPGQELFQYQDDDGKFQVLESNDVNEYLREITGQSFTAKDFRTWKASALVAEAIHRRLDDCPSKTEARRIVSQAIREAAESLGNTISICKKYYVHPSLAELFLAGEFSAVCNGFRPRTKKWMDPAEQVLLHVLQRRSHRRQRAA